MQLKQITGKSKKTGKDWIGYVVEIGRYSTPVFYPSEVELWYLQKYMEKGTENSKED